MAVVGASQWRPLRPQAEAHRVPARRSVEARAQDRAPLEGKLIGRVRLAFKRFRGLPSRSVGLSATTLVRSLAAHRHGAFRNLFSFAR